MAKLYIDNRENLVKDELCDFIKLNSDEIIFKNLEIGDFFLKTENKDVIIERKRIDDLYDSIISGRYNSQRLRIVEYLKENKNASCVYIIEGNENDFKIEKSYWGTIINLIFRDNIFVIQSSDLKKTCELLEHIFNNNRSYKDKSDMLDLSSFRKSKHLDHNKCFVTQLCIIPGVSEKTAKAICVKFNNFKEIILKLNEKSYKEKVFEFSEIKINNRRIGEKVGKKIVNFIFFENENLEKKDKNKKKYLFT